MNSYTFALFVRLCSVNLWPIGSFRLCLVALAISPAIMAQSAVHRAMASTPSHRLLAVTTEGTGAINTPGTTVATDSAVPQPKDFTVDVSMPYCDRAIPYSLVKPDAASAVLTAYLQSSGWHNWFEQKYELQINASSKTEPIWQDSLPSLLDNGNAGDPFGVANNFNDIGDPLLGDKNHKSQDTQFVAERLLMRTLYQPNFFGFACSFSYLTDSVPAIDQLTKDATGKNENFLGSGLARSQSSKNQSFDIADPRNPPSYLINIVRWKDASVVPSAKAATRGPQMYQVASDDWYLLNRSDKADHNHDLFTLFGPFKPKMMVSTVQALRITGQKQLIFVGIHLAPTPASSVPQPTTRFGIGIGPTELAWYTTANIHYDFNATKVDAVNVQDAKALWGILKTSVPFLPSATAQNSVPPTPLEQPAQMLQNFVLSSPTESKEFPKARDEVKAALSVVTAKLDNIDLLLRINADCTSEIAAASASAASIIEGVCSAESACSVDAVLPVLQSAMNATKTCSVGFTAQPIPKTGSAALEDLTDVFRNLVASVNVNVDPIYSLEQGLYGAAYVTDLQQLPVDLIGTWTATFTGATSAVTSPGGNQAYPVAMSIGPTAVASSLSICGTTLDTSDPNNPVQKPCSNGSPKVHDEKLAWWDVSLLVPTTGYSDLTYQVSTPPTAGGTTGPNIVTAKSVTRTNVYAMFDIMPFEQDLNNPPTIGIPYVAAGLPLAGKVFNKPYFAVGETFTIPQSLSKVHWLSKTSTYLPLSINPVFGWVYNKEFHTSTNPMTNAVSQMPYRALKPQFSIGFSFRSISSTVLSGLSKSSSKMAAQ